ncbi:outer membrane beta-barrel protein [Pedobacter boryungensis]|uniref:TonB-dependent receptor n=1 Tax=Pedobacter boryungensis TaxID=869962 RepID=A0ABX2DCX6_9SPHI|nr:outer membrane beta-barrel family protein [Pedobacter boryungensis]NQX31855.1 TonB-dependent receptor [Pedobacter boryungensis]
MKRLLLYFFAATLLSLFSFSAKAAENGVIRGKVIEEVGALPIPYAVVSIFESAAEQPLLTIQTDENGYFRFNNLKTGNYKVKVSYVGFAALFVNDISITDKDFDKNLGNLKLSSEQSNLNEVVISAQKPLVEFGADVITYNVGSSVLAEGSTATDVLKNVPMVQVDIDGNATISGKRSTRVFIDGKPSDYMTSNIADLLNVLPSDAIEKIEVMTNPPSKYSGDGEGILNIVMKKGFKVGFNGNVGITAGIQGNKNTNANASYRGKNYNLNGSAAYRENIGKGAGESYRTNFFPDTTFYYNQYNNNRNKSNGGNFRLGLDWDITPKQNLRLSTNYNINNSNSNSGNDFYYINEALVPTRLRNQVNLGDGNSNNFVFNADYNLQTDTTGGKLTMGVTLNTNANNDLRSYNRTYAFPVNLNPSLQQNDNEISNSGLNFNLDYDKPVFNKRDQLEFGIAYNYRKNDNDLLVQNFNYQTQELVTNKNLTNKFFYNENILSGYASYNYRKNGWGLKTGLRAEYTDVNFDLSTGTSYHVSPYLSLFPNVSLNHFFKKRYNFGATYSVRINRPREYALNPQVNNADTLNISFGNPDLSPAYTHQMDFSFGAFGKKWSFTPRISYSTSRGVIERYRTVKKNGVSESTFDNVGTNNALALMLIGNFRPTNKISANGNFSVIQSNYNSKLNSALNRDGLSLRSSLGFSMQLPYKTAFESNLNYANNINAQGRNKGSINSSFGARKSFFKNTLSARISTNDPFGRKNNNSFNSGTNFTSQSYSTNNSSNVTFSLNYRFTKVKVNKVVVPPPPSTKP